jgi:nitrous oxidase accessory protein
MQPMNTIWPWSSPACAISGIRFCKIILMGLIAFAFVFYGAQGTVIQAGQDIQAAIEKANPRDTVLVGPGDYSSFEVDRPITVLSQGGSSLQAAIQRPAIKISSNGVNISGFIIEGIGKDTTAKFNYYMENRDAAAGSRLDLPNAAIIVDGNDIILQNITVFGAQIGVMADNADNLSILDSTLESCDRGAYIAESRMSLVQGNTISNCKKYGLDAQRSSGLRVYNNSISGSANTGFLLKESKKCVVQGNVFSTNTFGLALWNSTSNQISKNRADHNYYGILITDWSGNNTIEDNIAEENTRSEIIKGFGIGISLQENSSHNLVVGNTARKNLNGIDIAKGCKFNAIYGNNIFDNSNGIRVDKNRNNLIFANNFERNTASAYDNSSRNIWNTTIGNYYSDYRGDDENGDGIGDKPYSIPKGDHDEADARPLMDAYRHANLDAAALRGEVEKYARFGPDDDEIPSIRMEGRTIAISYRRPSSPPKWPDSKPLEIT